METTRYAAFTCTLALAFSASAQDFSLTTSSTVPAVGTDVLMHRGAFTAVPAGGADVAHDLTGLTETSSSTYHWSAPSLSPNAGMFPTANLLLNNGGPDTIFYKTSALGFERVGETRTIDLLLANFPAGFTDPVLELPLPLAYNDTWTDGIAGTFDVDGSTGIRVGSLSGIADAYGYVSIPGYATPLPMLRTTTTVNESITITPSGIPFPIGVTHKRIEVAYRMPFSKMPVFRTVTDSLISAFATQVSNYSEWMDAVTVGIREAQADPFSLTAFPNPADAAVVIAFDMPNAGSTTLTVMDGRGTVVMNKVIGAHSDMRRTVDVKTWPSGIYQAVMTSADGSRSTKRFLVAH